MALREATLGSTVSHGAGAASATKRIQRELKEISESPSRHWTAAPTADDLFEWQFAIRGPPGTDFEGGIYTGRIVLPVNYPLAPPSITLLTPNGRWEVGKKICLSNTSYHPDLWQPAWGIRTMMEALRSHFPMPGDGAIGAVDFPSDIRQRLAKESLNFVTPPGNKCNHELLPDLSPEEIKEDLPLPAPLLPPEPSVAEEIVATPEGDVSAQAGSPSIEEPPATAAPALGAEGLRQRHTSAASTTASADSHGPVTRANTWPGAVATEASASGSSSSGSRRRREGPRQQRQERPLLVQVLKPPQTRRSWLILGVDVLILLLTVSFLSVLTDIIKTPPKLLDPLPQHRELKE